MAKGRPQVEGKRRVNRVLNLPRIRALYALRRIGKQLFSDVLADGSISEKFNIPTHRPANLGEGLDVHQEVLLRAFRQRLAGKPVRSIMDENGKPLKASVTISDNGTAQIVIADKKLAFSYAGFLGEDRSARRKLLDRLLKGHSLAATHEDELRALISARPLTDEDFLTAVTLLSCSPESFSQTVRSKVAVRDLLNSDLLPEDERHWENLTAPWRNSNTLQSFLSNELDAENARRYADSSLKAYLVGSLSYCAPGMVPLNRVEELDQDEVLAIVQRAANLPDHFSVTGAFEICAHRLESDARLKAAGSKLLENLLGDMDQLGNRCLFFAGAFLMTLAHLAQHQKLKRMPSYWRRVTAAANASLILRSCGSDNAESFFKWAVDYAGKPFALSVLLEETTEPRWKLDWLSAKHLIADAFGRLDATLQKLPKELRPADWVAQIEKAREWIAAENLEILCTLPAIGESSRRKPPSLKDTLVFRSFFEKFRDSPTIEALSNCTAGIYTVGAPLEIAPSCHSLIGNLVNAGARWSARETQSTVQMLSHLAVLFEDEILADLVAQFAMEKLRELSERESTLEIVCRLVECSSAYSDRQKGLEMLGKRLETVSFLVDPEVAFDLHDTLSQLQLLTPFSSLGLGRALAAARLAKAA